MFFYLILYYDRKINIQINNYVLVFISYVKLFAVTFRIKTSDTVEVSWLLVLLTAHLTQRYVSPCGLFCGCGYMTLVLSLSSSPFVTTIWYVVSQTHSVLCVMLALRVFRISFSIVIISHNGRINSGNSYNWSKN